MAKLTDTQLIILSAAAARDDGLASVPAKMNKPAAAKVGACLVKRKLMRELKAKSGMPVWRADDDGRPISLIITRQGRETIGVEAADESDKEVVDMQTRTPTRRVATKSKAGADSSAGQTSDASLPRKDTKLALVIGKLSTKSGATLEALTLATGWLPHTTRAALTGLRKRGFTIELTRKEGHASSYRIDSFSPAGATT